VILWPAVAVAGFLVTTAVVVALAASSTARYEFDRNLASEPARAPRRAAAHPGGRRHPAGRRAAAGTTATVPPAPAPGTAPAPAPAAAPEPVPAVAAVGLAAPAAPAAPAGQPDGAGEQAPAVGWWLATLTGQVLAGPFADRVEADWAALAGGFGTEGAEATACVLYGVRRADGTLTRRSSPQELAWLTELGAQLDRLGEDWDPLLSDSDTLTTLVVEVTAALVEAGLPLHDPAVAGGAAVPTGGVCLTPDPTATGILVSWRQHDRMSVQQVRGAEADAAVQATMNAAVACVLAELDFEVDQYGDTGVCIVTASGR
jgi:hypothetical protein